MSLEPKLLILLLHAIALLSGYDLVDKGTGRYYTFQEIGFSLSGKPLMDAEVLGQKARTFMRNLDSFFIPREKLVDHVLKEGIARMWNAGSCPNAPCAASVLLGYLYHNSLEF